MKTVWIIGAGMGPDTVTQEGLRAIQGADVLLGAKRMLAGFSYLGKPSIEQYIPQQVATSVRTSQSQRFAVLVSGDVGFFSAAQGLVQALDFCRVELVSGISSLHYFFARLQLPWQDAAAVSCHGRSCNLADTVRRNRLTFALTGGNIPELVAKLLQADFGDLQVFVGENLGMGNERIFSCPVHQLKEHTVGSLAVLLIQNPAASAQVPTGIPDGQFIRGAVPMTKAEVRAVILSKLNLKPETVCVDVGAGTGSVTVEMALAAWKGRVFAVERNPEALPLIQQNCKKFHIGNVESICGSAPEALEALPAVDAAFIGGSGGTLREIISALFAKNPAVRIVVSAITLESIDAAIEGFQSLGISPEVIQIGVSRAKKAGGLHLLMAQNPIFIFSGGGSNEG